MLKFLIALLFPLLAFGQAAPPATIAIKGGTDGTKIGNTGDALKVTLSGSLMGTVDQGAAGVEAWLVEISNFPVTQAISAVSLPLPAGASTSALQTTGNSSLSSIDSKITTTVNGIRVDIGASPLAVTGPLTDAQLRAAPIDVNGTFSVDALTDAELRASPVPVTANAGTGTFQVNVTNASIPVTQSGTWSSGRTWVLSSGTDSVSVSNFPASQNVVVTSSALPTGASTSALQTTGNSSLSSIDSKLTTTSNGVKVETSSVGPVVPGTVASKSNLGGVQFNSILPSLSNGQQVAMQSDANGRLLVGALPTGSSTIGSVNQAGSWTTGRTWSLLNTTDSVNVGNFPVSQNVIVTSSVLPSGAASSADLSPIASSLSSIDGKIPSNPARDRTTASSFFATRLTDGSAFYKATTPADTQPISVASLPLPTGAASETTLSSIDNKLTNGLQKSMVRGAAKGATAAGDVTSTNQSADRQAIDVQIRTSAGVAIDNFGAGTQYSDNDLVATPIGTVSMLYDGTRVQALSGTSAGVLKVDLSATTANATAVKVDGSAVTQPVSGPLTDAQLRAVAVPVSGTVTANQGGSWTVAATQSGSWTTAATQSGTWNINNVSGTISLPTGASTAANQSTTNSTLSTINSKIPAAPATDRALASAPFSTRLSDGTSFYKATTPSDIQPVSVSSLPLPSGAATSALQTTGNSSLSSIDSKIPASLTVSSTRLLVDGSGVTQPVSAASLPLPSGASTSALQTTGNASLSSIDSKLTSPLSVAQSGTWNTRMYDSLGVGITSTLIGGTYQALDVNAVGVTTATVADHNATGSLTAACASGVGCVAGSTLPLDINGVSAGMIDLTGTWTGTVFLDGSMDNFATFRNVTLWTPPASFIATGATANGLYRASAIAGFRQLRLRAGTLSSGTIDAQLGASVGVATVIPLSPNPASNLTQVYGSSTSAPIQTDGSGNILAAQTGVWDITDISGVISLPTGASTSANQVTANASLSSIDSKIPASLTVSSTRLLVDGSGVTQPISASSLPLPTGASTSANQTTANASLSSLDGKFSSLGQKTMANSAPVVLSSDQSAIPVSQSGTWNIVDISGTVSLPTGAATSANQSTGNASLSSIDGKLNSLGQKVMTASVPVVISSDQSAVPASQSGTWNINNVSGTVSLPTGASTSANQTTEIAALQILDNLVHANDAAFVNGSPVMGQFDDVATSAVTENNVSTMRITSSRGAHVNLRNASGTEIGTTTTPVVVAGNVAAASTDSGNPIKIGGVFNTTQPTLTEGQRGNMQLSSRGAQLVAGSAAVGSAPVDNPLSVSGVDGSGLKRHLKTDTNGSVQAVGDVASGATDSGNPVKVGAKYNSTAASITNGQRADLQSDQFGNLIVTSRNTYRRIVTATTTTVKSGAGYLKAICYNSSVIGSVATVYDNTAASGTIIAVIEPPNGHEPNCMPYELRFNTGLTIVTTSVEDYTIVYQ